MIPAIPGLYQIDDLATDAFYIGSAVDLRKRWSDHQYRLRRQISGNPRLQAIFNLDPSRLRFVVLESWLSMPRTDRLRYETALIAKALTERKPDCMNVLAVAGSHQGAKRSVETCERLRQANLGRTFTPETRAKMRAAKLGMKQDQAVVRKRAMAQLGKSINRPRGIINHELRRFSPDDVRRMRALRADGLSYSKVGAQFGLDDATRVRRIVLGHTYAEVQ